MPGGYQFALRTDSLLTKHSCFRVWTTLITLVTVIVVSGCSGNRNNVVNEEISTPGEQSESSKNPTPFVQLPTSTLINSVIATQPPEITLVQYSHPQQYFSLLAPEGWETSIDDCGVNIIDPSRVSRIRVSVVNTAYFTGTDTLVRFAQIRENTLKDTLESYIETGYLVSPDESTLTITKMYLDEGASITEVTRYHQFQDVISFIDISTPDELFSSFSNDVFEKIPDSMTIDTAAVSTLPIYCFDQAQSYSNGYFSVLIPYYWEIKNTIEDSYRVDTISSPDGNSVIQMILYNDGTPVNRSVAGGFALTLLQETYAKEISILKDEMIDNRFEKLTWVSLDGGYHGVTVFAVNVSQLMALTVMWSSDPDHHYQNLLESVLQSFTFDS